MMRLAKGFIAALFVALVAIATMHTLNGLPFVASAVAAPTPAGGVAVSSSAYHFDMPAQDVTATSLTDYAYSVPNLSAQSDGVNRSMICECTAKNTGSDAISDFAVQLKTTPTSDWWSVGNGSSFWTTSSSFIQMSDDPSTIVATTGVKHFRIRMGVNYAIGFKAKVASGTATLQISCTTGVE